MAKVTKKHQRELIDVIQRAAKDKRLLEAFLIDLLTPQEYNDIIARWQIVKALARHVTQRDIAQNLKVSIAKITRGSRELLDENGGFKQVLREFY